MRRPPRTPLALLAVLAAMAIAWAAAMLLGLAPTLLALDTRLYHALSAPAGSGTLHEIVRDVTALGSLTVLGVATASGAVYLIAAGRRAEAVWLLATVAVAFVATFLLKDVFGRARPPAPDDAPGVSSLSFPSAHAALTLVVVGACAVAAAAHARTRLAAIWTALLATVLITTIGASRVYLGVHYPGDVLGGWLLGGLVLAAALVARGVWLPPVKEYGATAPRM
jgi:undecaprenyl-diphosphatase